MSFNKLSGPDYSKHINWGTNVKWVPKKSKSLPETSEDLKQRVQELSIKASFQSEPIITTPPLENRVSVKESIMQPQENPVVIEKKPPLSTFSELLEGHWYQSEWSTIINIAAPYFQDTSTHTAGNRVCFEYLYTALTSTKKKVIDNQSEMKEAVQKWLSDTATTEGQKKVLSPNEIIVHYCPE